MKTKITFLGTANAVPNKQQQNSHLIVELSGRKLLIDCVGTAVVRLQEAGINPLAITDLILTHFHPDHVSGVPLLLMDLWLLGRKEPLAIYGNHDVLQRVDEMMGLFRWETWGGFYPVDFNQIPEVDQFLIVEDEQIQVWSSPVSHIIPCIGLRMQLPDGIVAYSSDTAPCGAMIRLAEGADILIHEATGEMPGHSSPEQAGQIAQQAGVKTLYLTHYPGNIDHQDYINRARDSFSGEIWIAQDLMTISF